jgi:23S rRNA (cytidine1920-2'-O)/16S rRNA (cytidine1409-2'-O)-methyltransferase
MKERLDGIVVRKGWAGSKEEAISLIRIGAIRVNSLVRTDPSVRAEYDRVDRIDLETAVPFVSRGGYKLAGAIDFFGLSVRGLRVADLGASTGGFTDCLLRKGAAEVWAIDVGKGLLDARLRGDPRVTVVESANVRYQGTWIPAEPADGVVIDLSFISICQVLPSVRDLLRKGGWCLSLVKPQFEAQPDQVEKGGIVRSHAVRRRVLQRVLNDFAQYECGIRGVIPAPLRGRKGNQEYFFLTIWKGSD